MKSAYIKELDGVRGIAALMVMCFHFFQSIQITSTDHLLNLLQKITVFGQTGVTLFFVLSGFLITRILYDSKGSDSYFSTFYIRRSLRIFPLYYLFLAIYYYLVPLIRFSDFTAFNQQWYYWVYLQNFALTFKWPNNGPNHFWSLAVEEHFYLFWPIAVVLLNPQRLKLFIYFLILSSLITRIILIKNGYGVFYFTFTNIDALAIGALLALNEKDDRLNSKVHKKYLFLFIASSISIVILWLFTGGKSLDAIQIFKFPLIALTYYSLLGVVVHSTSTTMKRFLTAKWLHFSGKISYGLYVYHPLCFGLYHSYFHFNLVTDLILTFFTSYLIAYISYEIFESKFIKLKKHFSYHSKPVSLN